MNGGAYGAEVKDILIDCDVVLRSGEQRTLPLADLGYTYRHSELPEGAVVTGATFRGRPGEAQAIQAEMDRISASREASQPLRSKTGGSTFKNPDGHKARSEEHTSELQSLMRNSSAVLCLTKQKHTQ